MNDAANDTTPRAGDRFAADCYPLESLEPRLLLSADLPVTTGGIVSLDWGGQSVQVLADEWIVQFGAAAEDDVLTASLATAGFAGAGVRTLGDSGYGLMTAPGATADQLNAWAAGRAEIVYMEPNFSLGVGDTLMGAPSDPDFSRLWGLHNIGQAGGRSDADIDGPQAWDLTTGSDNVVIAIIDTGIDYTHPDLAGNIWTNPGEIPGNGRDDDGNGYVDDVHGYDFANNDGDPRDDQSHGTHVAGTIGGTANNGIGVAGVNWDVQLMALKFLDSSGSGSTADALEAIDYATKMKRDYGINIVATNNSWGGGFYSSAMKNAIEAGGDAGILFVAAAGNSSFNSDLLPSYPAGYDSDAIISVAATDHNDQMASFSNYGRSSVDLGAPGAEIYSTVLNGRYDSYSGTSMATPHVAGVVGLLAAYDPQASIAQIKAAILNGADPISSLDGRTVTGARLNAHQALLELGGGDPGDPGEPGEPGEPDIVGPGITHISPAPTASPTDRVVVTFDEAVRTGSLDGDNFLLRTNGDDNVFDTPDDLVFGFADEDVSQPASHQARIDLPAELAPESYRLIVVGAGNTPVEDLAGNPLNDGDDEVYFFTITGGGGGRGEPNDTIAQAVETDLFDEGSESFPGNIGNGASPWFDVDVFRVETSGRATIVADVDAYTYGSTLDAVLRLFDEAGRELAVNDDADGLDPYLTYQTSGAGRYYVGVSGYANLDYDPNDGNRSGYASTGNYDLTLTLTALPADDGPIDRIGPDGYGYVAEAIGHDFEDISATGQIGIGTKHDDVVFRIAAYELSEFDFSFYGRSGDDLYVSSNGLITFGQSVREYENASLTNGPAPATIAALWDDLVTTTDDGSAVLWELRGAGDSQRLVIQWNQVQYYGDWGTGAVTFQAVLYEADDSIELHYADLGSWNWWHDEAASATVGIKDAGAQAAGEYVLQVTHNGDGGNFVGSGRSTRIVLGAAAEPVPGRGGTANDVKYDADGNLHFAWFDPAEGNLQYAVQDAGTGRWSAVAVVDADSPEVGQYVSMAIDSTGRPGLAYYDAYNADLKYAHFNGTAWVVETVHTRNRTGMYPSLAFGATDRPTVAYYKPTGGYLLVAEEAGGQWDFTVIDGEARDVGRYASLRQHPTTGRWAVAYEDTTAGAFKYAEQTETGRWVTSTFDDKTLGGGGYISLAFDADGNPAVSYYDAHQADLKFARRTDGTWTAETVAGRRSQGLYTNLFFDAAGQANIAYWNRTTDSLVLARQTAQDWDFDVLVAGGGREAKVALNPLQPAGDPDGLTATWYCVEVPCLGIGTVR